MAVRRLANGRFAKVTVIPEASRKLRPRQAGGQVIMQTRGIPETAEALKALRVRSTAKLLSIPERRAASIQGRLQAAIVGAYHRASTGRMARGIRAKVIKTGTPGGAVSTTIRITMMNYRESRFLTNIGGGGYFKDFPIRPYRIFAKGVEPFTITDNQSNFLINPHTGRRSLKHTRQTVGAIQSANGVGRLKVPRNSSFFTSSRAPGRGGGESRVINDILGPAETGEAAGVFFFYPLWVNHPGFTRDVISEVALDEGAKYQEEVLTAVTLSHKALRTKSLVVSSEIPIAELGINQVAGTRFAPGVDIQVPASLIRTSRR